MSHERRFSLSSILIPPDVRTNAMLLRARQVESYTNRSSSYPKLTSGCGLPIAQVSLLRTELSRPYFASSPDIRSNLAIYRSLARIGRKSHTAIKIWRERARGRPNQNGFPPRLEWGCTGD